MNYVTFLNIENLTIPDLSRQDTTDLTSIATEVSLADSNETLQIWKFKKK